MLKIDLVKIVKAMGRLSASEGESLLAAAKPLSGTGTVEIGCDGDGEELTFTLATGTATCVRKWTVPLKSRAAVRKYLQQVIAETIARFSPEQKADFIRRAGQAARGE